MTLDDRFGRTLSTWLTEEAEHRVPDHLAEVLLQTAATRQRPWWSSLERLLPVLATMPGGITSRRPVVLLLAIVALLAALAGAVLIPGALRTAPTPIGLPANGRIFVMDAGAIRSFAADGSDGRTVVPTLDRLWQASLSPDGSRLAYLHGEAGANVVTVLDLASGESRDIATKWSIGEESLGWSPDGTSIAFQGVDSATTDDRVFVAAADGSGVSAPGADAMDPALGIWQPTFSPDGGWIAYLARPKGSDEAIANGDIMVMRRDGSDLHRVATGAQWPGSTWSPDPSVQRLLYTTASGPAIVDLGGTPVFFATGFWPAWSPDGQRIAYWHDGVRVIATAAALRGAAGGEGVPVGERFSSSCQEAADLAGRTFCSPVTWSPDGTKLVGADVVGTRMLIANVDGTGTPVPVPLVTSSSTDVKPLWQGVRP